MRNPSKMIAYSKQQSTEKQKLAIQKILLMIENKERVTFYSVKEKTGFSKSFLYNNPDIRELIETYRPTTKINLLSDERDELIKNLRNQIQVLENKIRRIEKDELWKEKFQNINKKVQELEKQLETAYKF